MSVYDFTVKNAKGEAVSLARYKGKVLLIVNVASKCGFTPQYEGLEKLYKKYEDQGLVILGFPCNQFGEQEPGSNEEIHSFCTRNYGVTFPIMDKIEVNGEHTAPLYQYLKAEKADEFIDVPEDHKFYQFFKEFHGGDWGSDISWNFNKFLIDRNGHLVGRYASPTTPEELDSKIAKLI